MIYLLIREDFTNKEITMVNPLNFFDKTYHIAWNYVNNSINSLKFVSRKEENYPRDRENILSSIISQKLDENSTPSNEPSDLYAKHVQKIKTKFDELEKLCDTESNLLVDTLMPILYKHDKKCNVNYHKIKDCHSTQQDIDEIITQLKSKRENIERSIKDVHEVLQGEENSEWILEDWHHQVLLTHLYPIQEKSVQEGQYAQYQLELAKNLKSIVFANSENKGPANISLKNVVEAILTDQKIDEDFNDIHDMVSLEMIDNAQLLTCGHTIGLSDNGVAEIEDINECPACSLEVDKENVVDNTFLQAFIKLLQNKLTKETLNPKSLIMLLLLLGHVKILNVENFNKEINNLEQKEFDYEFTDTTVELPSIEEQQKKLLLNLENKGLIRVDRSNQLDSILKKIKPTISLNDLKPLLKKSNRTHLTQEQYAKLKQANAKSGDVIDRKILVVGKIKKAFEQFNAI